MPDFNHQPQSMMLTLPMHAVYMFIIFDRVVVVWSTQNIQLAYFVHHAEIYLIKNTKADLWFSLSVKRYPVLALETMVNLCMD